MKLNIKNIFFDLLVVIIVIGGFFVLEFLAKKRLLELALLSFIFILLGILFGGYIKVRYIIDETKNH